MWAALLIAERERLYLNRKAAIVYPPEYVVGQQRNNLKQGVFRKLQLVFKKLGLDIFDISIMNKHHRKYASPFVFTIAIVTLTRYRAIGSSKPSRPDFSGRVQQVGEILDTSRCSTAG